MAKIVDQITEFGRNIEQMVGAEIKQNVMAGSEKITNQTKPSKIAAWMQGVITRLDELVPEMTRIKIMENCGQNCATVNQNVILQAKARRNKYADLDEFLTAEQKKPTPGTKLIREGNVLFQSYLPQNYVHPMRCFCSLLRGLPPDEKVSLTYCHCSKGFVQKYWEAVLERTVTVELLSSVVAGASECRFKITF